MKTVLILLAIVAFAAAGHISPLAGRSISTTVISIIEDKRDRMPCGFPGLGIPPLAPLKIPHKDINIDTPIMKVQGSIHNFRLNGLNDFEVAEMKVNAITSKVVFRFIFTNVNVDTEYDLNMVLKKAGFTINAIGKGPAKFAIKDMHIWGTVKYSLGVISRKLKLKTLEVRTHINEVESDIEGILGEAGINHKMNDILEDAVEIAINENEQTITDTIEALAMPAVNDVLDDVTLNDLVSIIGGEDEKEACIPPEDD